LWRELHQHLRWRQRQNSRLHLRLMLQHHLRLAWWVGA
jgi:hypothetical protein